MQSLLLEHSLTRAIVATIAEPLLVLDGGLRVVGTNPAFFRHFNVVSAETVDHTVYALGNGQWDIASLRHLLEEVLSKNRRH